MGRVVEGVVAVGNRAVGWIALCGTLWRLSRLVVVQCTHSAYCKPGAAPAAMQQLRHAAAHSSQKEPLARPATLVQASRSLPGAQLPKFSPKPARIRWRGSERANVVPTLATAGRSSCDDDACMPVSCSEHAELAQSTCTATREQPATSKQGLTNEGGDQDNSKHLDGQVHGKQHALRGYWHAGRLPSGTFALAPLQQANQSIQAAGGAAGSNSRSDTPGGTPSRALPSGQPYLQPPTPRTLTSIVTSPFCTRYRT